VDDSAETDLPPLYAGWVRELLGGLPPREIDATCDRCAMVSANPDRQGFDPGVKCCSYMPELYNFLAGGILTEDDPTLAAGRASVRERIARRTGVTPLGLTKPRSYLLLYDSGGDLAFGRSKALLCPHFLDDGRCGVWRHREASCATWYCKFVRGQVGRAFWTSLLRMLVLVERALAWWCVQRLELPPCTLAALDGLVRPARRSLDPSDLDRSAPADYDTLWGGWAGREEELYRACAARVQGMAWRDAVALAGVEAEVAAAIVRDNYAALRSDALPERVAVGAFQLAALDAERCHIRGYSNYDPIELPTAVLDVLARFDGRPVDDVIAELGGEGVEIERALVRRLVDLGVLVAK
jgi:hypothetical protein